MKAYRLRRKAAEWYREHRGVDLTLAVVGFGAVGIPNDERMNAIQTTFLGAAAAIVALLIAIVTFACAFVYQSANPHVAKVRESHSAQLKSNWLWCVGWVLSGSVGILACIPLSYWHVTASWAFALAFMGLSVAVTIRSLDYLRFAMEP